MKKVSLLFWVILVICVSGTEKDKDKYEIILKRNIFTAPYIEETKVKKKSILKPLPPPSLEQLLEVKGIVLISGISGYGIVELKGKNIEVILKKNDKIMGAKVIDIGKDFITFLYNGKKEILKVKKPEGSGFIRTVGGVEVKIEESKTSNVEQQPVIPDFEKPIEVEFYDTINALKNDKELFKKLNISPYIRDGKIEGFKIGNLPENSLPFKYGLRDGDVIRRVNGILIDSITKGYAVYNQIVASGTKLVTVEILRDGKPLVLSYRLK